MKRATIVLILAMLAVTVSVAPFSGASDALLDAKRDAAAKLLKDGKSAEAQKLYEEVVAQDAGTWSDHYALAKLYDKSGDTAKAVEAYRTVKTLLSSNARTGAERSALSDSEKRLDVLDQLSGEIEAATKEFFKALDKIDKDAAKIKDKGAADRTFQLRAAILAAEPRNGWAAFQVPPNRYVDTGYMLEAGKTYTIEARGKWTVEAGVSCSPAGRTDIPPNASGRVGGLVALVSEGGNAQFVGEATTFKASANAQLRLVVNEPSDRWSDNRGFIWAIVKLLD
jgi:tetratricopeptide (TPR) repeat protein